MENELNKVLSDIYSEMEKLQSAREQVEIITESSKELTMVTSILLKELRDFSNHFGKENLSNVSQLNKSLIDFESKINKISEKGNESINEYIVSFKNHIIVVIEEFSQQIAINENNLTAISNLSNQKISYNIEEFEKTTKNLKINAENGIEEIKRVALNKIEIQEQIISKTIANIENINTKNKKLITTITEFDIPKRLEEIDNKLVIQFNQNKLIKKLLIVVLFLLGLAVAVEFGLIIKSLKLNAFVIRTI